MIGERFMIGALWMIGTATAALAVWAFLLT
jgi:hypothetical protein